MFSIYLILRKKPVYTVFHRKMSHILDLFKIEGKIMNIMLVGVFIVLNDVIRG